MFNKLKPYLPYIIGTVSGAIIIYVVIVLSIGNPADYKRTKKELKAIQSQVDSINKVQANNQYKIDSLNKLVPELNKKIDKNNNSIRYNNSKIDENNQKLNKIKSEYHEKINSVDKYQPSDVDSFFAHRYKQYYPK